MNPVAVKQAGIGLRQIAMPNATAIFRQGDPLDLASSQIVEEAKLDLLGMSGEQREICAAGIHLRTEGKRPSGANVRCHVDSSFKCGRQIDRRKRRQGQRKRLRTPMPRQGLGIKPALVGDAAAAIARIVRVEYFAIRMARRHTDAIILAHDRREIDDNDDVVACFAAATLERYDACAAVRTIDPFEAGTLVIELVKRTPAAYENIQVADKGHDALVKGVSEQMPIEASVVIPFALLTELIAHEEKLFAGMAVHEAVIGSQIGEALPAIAGHAPEDRPLAMDNFVMAQRQDEIFRKSVKQAEGEL